MKTKAKERRRERDRTLEGQRLRILRFLMGMSVREFCIYVGITRDTLYQIESGRYRHLYYSTIRRFEQSLRMEWSRIVPTHLDAKGHVALVPLNVAEQRVADFDDSVRLSAEKHTRLAALLADARVYDPRAHRLELRRATAEEMKKARQQLKDD